MNPWTATDTSDPRALALADRHYTRQTPGSPQFMRPGFRLVLYCNDATGGAVFGWWRPKWEDGRPELQRKDGLRAIECVIFRNETRLLSSDLIIAACAMVQSWHRARDTEWPDGLITGVNATATAHRRGRRSLPGHCFRMAGFEPFDHRPGRADVWLRCMRLPPASAIHWMPRGQKLLFFNQPSLAESRRV